MYRHTYVRTYVHTYVVRLVYVYVLYMDVRTYVSTIVLIPQLETCTHFIDTYVCLLLLVCLQSFCETTYVHSHTHVVYFWCVRTYVCTHVQHVKSYVLLHHSPSPDDKPIRTSVIMAGSQNKKQKHDRSANGDDEIGEEEEDPASSTHEGADSKVLHRDISDTEMDIPNSSPPASPASSENSTSTNQSGPHDVLLRVSEAHLALLADEDGDTPLHIAIIHEKLDLVKHMVKTITGVFMNLDIANHMRQVCVCICVCVHKLELHTGYHGNMHQIVLPR